MAGNSRKPALREIQRARADLDFKVAAEMLDRLEGEEFAHVEKWRESMKRHWKKKLDTAAERCKQLQE
jgi:hypothetical protein